MDSFKRLGDAIKRYLQGIYGFDQLGGVLLVAVVLCLLLGGSNLFGWLLAFALLVWGWYRALSHDHEARASENAQFLGLVDKIKSWFKGLTGQKSSVDEKVEVRCPSCGRKFLLPKGLGTLRATCPHCGEKSVHKV